MDTAQLTLVVTAAIGVCQIALGLFMWLAIKPQAVGKWFAIPTIIGSRLMLILLLGGLTFSGYVLYRTVRLSSYATPIGASLVKAWGNNGPLCTALIDTVPLWKVRDKYRYAVACGIVDGTVDRHEDSRISVSALFNIRNGPVMINFPHRPAMAEALQKDHDERLKAFKPPPKGSAAVTNANIWYEVLLLPPSINTADIHRLTDVARYGGRVITSELLESIE